MPLDKSGSKASVGKNIKTEMHAGKPQKQAIAIALSTQRRAQGKPSHLAHTVHEVMHKAKRGLMGGGSY